MFSQYFKSLYQSTMSKAYDTAYAHIASAVNPDSTILDCGASEGSTFELIAKRCDLKPHQYSGIEWNAQRVADGQRRGFNIVQGDLNRGIPGAGDAYSCIYALSVLEHLLYPCRFMQDCHRVLRPGGRLVLLTPNISTYFTAVLILLGKMPSSGPHPDSDLLLKSEEIFKVSSEQFTADAESDTPQHRHLIVFSYRVLHRYLSLIGFSDVKGYGFGLYPFPKFTQSVLERLNPYHCHQMVFVATK